MKRYLLIVAAAVALSACAKAPSKGSAPAPSGDARVKTQQTAPDAVPSMNNTEVAAHLESLAKRVPMVESAHAVVVGKTAIVGINVKPELDRARVDTIKYSVAEALRKDPYGVNALVTADMDLDRRIQELRQQAQSGHPLSGFANELGDIIGRILPQLPKDVNPAGSPPPHSENPQNFQNKSL